MQANGHVKPPPCTLPSPHLFSPASPAQSPLMAGTPPAAARGCAPPAPQPTAGPAACAAAARVPPRCRRRRQRRRRRRCRWRLGRRRRRGQTPPCRPGACPPAQPGSSRRAPCRRPAAFEQGRGGEQLSTACSADHNLLPPKQRPDKRLNAACLQQRACSSCGSSSQESRRGSMSDTSWARGTATPVVGSRRSRSAGGAKMQ